MTDWNTCPAVERNPRKISGAWAFTGTRVPVYALFENLAAGATIDEFVEWFPGVEERQGPRGARARGEGAENGGGALRRLSTRALPPAAA